MTIKYIDMKKTVVSIGAGYVGTPTMVVFAEHCPEHIFLCVDVNEELIRKWQSDKLPVYEPNLEQIIKKVRDVNLFFTSDAVKAIESADIIFISVCTPTKTYGLGADMACDLSYFESVAKTIRDHSKSYKVIVEKSTVPIGTGVHLQTILDSNQFGIKYDIISNPEFLAEGTAVNDLEHPNRVLIGCQPSKTSEKAIQEVVDLYRHWINDEKVITTDRWTSELAKLVANCFLAQRVSSINSISMICETMGGNILDISKILGMDPRIGSQFLNSSIGFGGSCFHKDLLDLIYLCEYHHLQDVAEYWRYVILINDLQKRRFTEQIIHTLYDSVKNRVLTIFGFSFKKDTGDTRESPAITVCQLLLTEGAILHIYDPKVTEEQINKDLGNYDMKQIKIYHDPYEACQQSEAIIILTAWTQFKTLDYHNLYDCMEHPSYVFDSCNLVDSSLLQNIGFKIHILGRTTSGGT
jgi:UDPglucose 6-dehydrogenase